MFRPVAAALLAGLFASLAPSPARAQESAPETAEEAALKRIGFYFGLRLTSLAMDAPADGIAVDIDRPAVPGLPFDTTGPSVDVDFESRLNLEFLVGFRLRDAGAVEATFIQWDEQKDLRQDAADGRAFYNTLASPLAGINEDVNGDGMVIGYEAGSLSEVADNNRSDSVRDGAEDLNYTGVAEFLPFDHSNRIVGQASVDYQAFDVDYRRRLKDGKRVGLDWRAGLRLATLNQTYDIGYRQVGSFAVFIDEEADIPTTPAWNCPSYRNPVPVPNLVQDGDGDGETTTSNNERDGDGFLNGNCNATIGDRLESVPTLSEDRIIARFRTRGYGVKAGLDGRLDLTKKWRMTGAVGVSLLQTTSEFTFRETFTSEQDRYANFIEWDFNGDGVYDMFDLDFDGSCNTARPAAECELSTGEGAAIMGSLPIRYRDGIDRSVVASPRGLNADAFRAAGTGVLREGDPVPESERNNDVIKETRLLADLQGEASGAKPAVDLQLGFEWQFSRFANVGFGVRASRWFDAGSFGNLVADIKAARSPAVDGDFTLTGAYVTLTVVPR